MSLKAQLTEDMKTAMKGGLKEKLGVIRLINAAIKQREVDERITLDDSQVLAVLEKMSKQRKDSIEQYSNAGREDLAEVERAELVIIQAYLPAQLSEAELLDILNATIAEIGATGPKDMGKVIGALRPKVAGRADLGKLSEQVKARLAAL
ncbi:glutamyl-tRNA amidotransferase [Ahniella affigens]|uniref:Glutamyl-tRNA amidotransferase n=1 Tax=Ahniella affigens TaxID=2021234 RepID=A0A2P1PXV8_9GAMM|nr:GatB/YqeY domain-containing protein [Ahniella affigens]AVP99678.1 glutamyl-tRNA amidotransferase [Ahniella affigens]